MHEQGVAHRYVTIDVNGTMLILSISDCAAFNTLMNADALYPRGYHPANLRYLPDMSGLAPRLPREYATQAVKYYYADFGLSSHFPHDSPDKLILGEYGRERDVPELSNVVPYDPFKVDIFIVGSIFKKNFDNVRATGDVENVMADSSWLVLFQRRVSAQTHPAHDFEDPCLPVDCGRSSGQVAQDPQRHLSTASLLAAARPERRLDDSSIRRDRVLPSLFPVGFSPGQSQGPQVVLIVCLRTMLTTFSPDRPML